MHEHAGLPKPSALGAAPRRDRSLDIIRGVAVLLVVVFHAGTMTRATIRLPDWFVDFNAVASPLRIPTLVFLSGLLVTPSLRKGTRRFFSGKLRMIAWPYLVWSVLMLVLLAGTASITHNGYSVADVGRIIYDPIAHLWFLYYLLFFYGIAWLLRGVAADAAPLAFAGVSTAAWLTGHEDLQVFFFLAAFFMAGAVVSRREGLLDRLASSRLTQALGLCSLGAVIYIGLHYGDVRYLPPLMPLILPVVFLALAATRKLLRRWRGGPLPWMGVNSIIFYVVHYPAMIVVSNVAQLFTLDATLLLSAVLLSGPVAGAVVALWVNKDARGRWLFEFAPARARRPSVRREPTANVAT